MLSPLRFAVPHVGTEKKGHVQTFPLAIRHRGPPQLSGKTTGRPIVKVGCFERIESVGSTHLNAGLLKICFQLYPCTTPIGSRHLQWSEKTLSTSTVMPLGKGQSNQMGLRLFWGNSACRLLVERPLCAGQRASLCRGRH